MPKNHMESLLIKEFLDSVPDNSGCVCEGGGHESAFLIYSWVILMLLALETLFGNHRFKIPNIF